MGTTLSFGDRSQVFPLVSDSLPSLPNRAINIFLLPLPISVVRKITRSKRLPRRVLRDAVGQSVGFALLTSVFTAGIELSQRQNTSLLSTLTVGQTASSAVGQQLGELGTEITRKNLSIQPTVKIPIGYRFNVRVNRDILFETPYIPAEL